jgi:F0F1-type ATP synthase alpha subunit
MPSLLNEIEAQIADVKTTAAKQNVGIIREIGDGVAKVEGLSDVMLNEMLDLGHGITGLALNLEETEVGVIILGDYTQLQEGDEVRTTGKLAASSIPWASQWTARGRSKAKSPTRSRNAPPGLSAANRFANRCKRASC